MGCRTWKKIEVKNFDQNNVANLMERQRELRSEVKTPMAPARISERSIREPRRQYIFDLAGHEEVEFREGRKSP